MKKLLFITNCQGPTLLNRFLRRGYADFERQYQSLPVIQIHRRSPEDAPREQEMMAQADVIVAQPVFAQGHALHFEAIRRLCDAGGKTLLTIPALHFSGQFATERTTVWPGEYPFGRTEDLLLAALYCKGISASEAATGYHATEVFTGQELRAQVDRAIEEFRARERAVDYSISMSGYYAQHLREDWLHYVKSHPRACVYAYMVEQVAGRLGCVEATPDQTVGAKGNDQFSLPLKAWVKQSLGLRCADEEGACYFQNAKIPFEEVISHLWAYYDRIGRAQILQAYGTSPVFERVLG